MSGMEMMLMAAGTAMQTIGAIRQGNAEASAAQYNAQAATQEAAAKEAAQRRQADQVQGQLRASLSKSGVRMEGTPLAVLAESAAEAEIDAQNTRWNRDREVAIQGARASNARTAGYLNAGTSLLTGLSKIK